MINPLAALGSADRWLLLKINRDWTAAWLNQAMPMFTDLHKIAWFKFGAAPAALALWLWKERRRGLKVLIVAGLAMGAGDLLSYRVIRPWASRPRPVNSGVPVILRSSAASYNGFPSNHSVNAAAAASVLAVAYPGAALVFAAVAGLIGYSRVYVGVHYPGDVLAGFALGAAIGWPWALLMLGGGGPPGKKKRR
jgi:undecaprenyl-diphosphatase